MTKKINSTAKWKRHMRARQAYELKKAQRNKTRPRRKSIPLARFRSSQLTFVTLVPPANLSIIENPVETLTFFSLFRHRSRVHNITLNLSDVTHITVDAAAALVAEIAALGKLRLVNGSTPRDVTCRDWLNQSGFFDHVKSREPLPPSTRGRIVPKRSKIVEPLTAQELIRIGTTAAHGAPSRSNPIYSTLIECMSNTHNHATGSTKTMGTENWYSAVYGDRERKCVCCAFLDTGVGIFRSKGYGIIRKAYNLIFGEDDRHILRDMLAGRESSRTGLPYRGKGLPGIFSFFRRGEIKTLVIVANDVYANVATDDYRLLDVEFPGTLLYWEA